MKAILKTTSKLIGVDVYDSTDDGTPTYLGSDGHDYKESDLDFNVSTTIEGWVARDRNNDLSLYPTYPERQLNLGYWRDGIDEIELPQDAFPFVTWLSEPLHVKLTITPME